MPAQIDTLSNLIGGGHSGTADRLIANNMDVGVLRPWLDQYGRSCVSVTNGYNGDGTPKYKTMLTNAPATLLKDEWIRLDDTVIRTARPELVVWNTLVSRGLVFNMPNAMATTVLQHQTMTEAGEAGLSMDALVRTSRDRPVFEIEGVPLPIVHSEFSFPARELAISRAGRMPLDTTMAEMASRRCAETIERLALGTLGSYYYAGYNIYGLTNYPSRITKTFTLPTAGGWVPQVLVDEVLDAMQSLRSVYFNGPYLVFYSPAWGKYLDADYSAAYNGSTLRTRLTQIADISTWVKSDYLSASGSDRFGLDPGSGFTIVIVQASSAVVQAIQGLALTTLQWDESGGLEKKFKVMGIMVPRLRKNNYGNTGILHAVAA